MCALAVDKFDHIEYLKDGAETQRTVYGLLREAGILEMLSPYNALLVGTIPIEISIDSSDLDIICFSEKLDDFRRHAEQLFQRKRCFRVSDKAVQGERTIVIHFMLGTFAVEIFAQRIPVKEQNGYRHMVKEFEILTKRGQEFRQKIIALKNRGIKTEPAFAQLLEIKGDPYIGLLNYIDR